MMMTEASFAGYDLLYEGYQRALKEDYKFGCYGDALLMLDDYNSAKVQLYPSGINKES